MAAAEPSLTTYWLPVLQFRLGCMPRQLQVLLASELRDVSAVWSFSDQYRHLLACLAPACVLAVLTAATHRRAMRACGSFERKLARFEELAVGLLEDIGLGQQAVALKEQVSRRRKQLGARGLLAHCMRAWYRNTAVVNT